jgi:squalene-hopene/tetraprenyl-beta-curcumene cyclase
LLCYRSAQYLSAGLVVYVLRQAGQEATAEPIRRGVTWLRTNQRASGHWFTRSLNRDGKHPISTTGTAFALLALRACGVSDALSSP